MYLRNVSGYTFCLSERDVPLQKTMYWMEYKTSDYLKYNQTSQGLRLSSSFESLETTEQNTSYLLFRFRLNHERQPGKFHVRDLNKGRLSLYTKKQS